MEYIWPQLFAASLGTVDAEVVCMWLGEGKRGGGGAS